MSLDERIITEAILADYFEKFRSCLDLDVAIVGAGPSGMVAGRRLALQGYKVAIFERKLAPGGGMWGGGMLFNSIVVQDEAKPILDDLGVPTTVFKENYHVADAVTATTTLASKACLAGVKFFNAVSVEDVVLREVDGVKSVCGLVINYTPVLLNNMHVDPLVIHAKFVLDSTGHDMNVLKTLVRKNDVKLFTPTGGIEGEQSMWADVAETKTPANTKEIFPGVYVTGMAANASFGSYRMGPIFGGMLLSGEKAATEVGARLASMK